MAVAPGTVNIFVRLNIKTQIDIKEIVSQVYYATYNVNVWIPKAL